MKFKFTPGMFENFCDCRIATVKDAFRTEHGLACSTHQVAESANAILQKHLEGLPRVYGFKDTDDDWVNEYNHSDYGKEETHTAILWDCEPIEGE